MHRNQSRVVPAWVVYCRVGAARRMAGYWTALWRIYLSACRGLVFGYSEGEMMRTRSRLLALAATISAVLSLTMTSSATADYGSPVDGGQDSKLASVADVGITAEPTLIQGWDNINWSNALIVTLSAPPCDNSADVDYAINNLGNNNNEMSSIQVNPVSNCVLVVWDGPNFTGNSIAITAASGGCRDLGNCNGENLWKRVNSLQLL